MEKINDLNNTADREIVTTRVLNAPRELVFKVWTDPEHVAEWWGPIGFTNTIYEMEVRPGGVWRFMMHGPDGIDYPNKIVFSEVVEPERLVYTHGSDDENDPLIFNVTVTFEAQGDKTKLTMRTIFDTAAERDRIVKEVGAIEGAIQTFNRFENHLAAMSGENDFVMERTYNATADKVWSAITDKNEMKQWYFDLPDFRAEVGFEFEFSGCSDEENVYLHKCRVTEVVPGKKLTYSWRYEGYEGNSFVTFELFPEGDKTRLMLTHAGLHTFPASNPDFARKSFVAGWNGIIGRSLKNYLEHTPNS